MYTYYSDRLINSVLEPLKDRIAKGGFIRNQEAVQICVSKGLHTISKKFISDIFTVIMRQMVFEGNARCVGMGYWHINVPPGKEELEIKIKDHSKVFDPVCGTRINPAKLAYEEIKTKKTKAGILQICEKHGCTVKALLEYIKLKDNGKTTDTGKTPSVK